MDVYQCVTALRLLTCCAVSLVLRALCAQDLAAIDELAIMTVLCCDKTGTLTLNKVRLTSESAPPLLDGVGTDDLLTAAALSTKWWEPPRDALDALVLCAIDTGSLNEYEARRLLSILVFSPHAERLSGASTEEVEVCSCCWLWLTHQLRAVTQSPTPVPLSSPSAHISLIGPCSVLWSSWWSTSRSIL